MTMNLPNRITLLRVILIPAFLVIFFAAPFHNVVNQWFALILFVAAAVTDAFDGHYARKYNLVTNFGKLMDPLADKLLVCSVLVAFTSVGLVPAWAVILLIGREFYVSGLRQLALERSLVLAATKIAKFKTIAQITLIVYILLPPPFDWFIFSIITWILIIATILLSIASAADYTIKNIQIFTPPEKE